MTNIEFNNLVYTASKSLKYPALKITKNSSSADELLKTTVQNALKSKKRFLEGTNIKAWLFLIMKDAYADNFQKTDDYKRELAKTPEKENSQLASQEINKYIENLDKIFKEPFIMHFSGFKLEEIAEKLRLPLGTVKNRIHVARKILLSELNNERS